MGVERTNTEEEGERNRVWDFQRSNFQGSEKGREGKVLMSLSWEPYVSVLGNSADSYIITTALRFLHKQPSYLLYVGIECVDRSGHKLCEPFSHLSFAFSSFRCNSFLSFSRDFLSFIDFIKRKNISCQQCKTNHDCCVFLYSKFMAAILHGLIGTPVPSLVGMVHNLDIVHVQNLPKLLEETTVQW